jgi:hypothetical protein
MDANLLNQIYSKCSRLLPDIIYLGCGEISAATKSDPGFSVDYRTDQEGATAGKQTYYQ